MNLPFTVLDARGRVIARTSSKREAHQLALAEGGTWRREELSGPDAPVERALAGDWEPVELSAEALGALFGDEPSRRHKPKKSPHTGSVAGRFTSARQALLTFSSARTGQVVSIPAKVTVEAAPTMPPKRMAVPDPEDKIDVKRKERDLRGRPSGSQIPIVRKPKESDDEYNARLLTAALGGNMVAYAQLFEQNRKIFASFVRRFLKSRDESVDDVVQDVLIETWNARSTIPDDVGVWRSWTFKSLQNRSLSQFRHDKLRRHAQVEDEPIPAEVAIEHPVAQGTFGASSPEHVIDRTRGAERLRRKVFDVLDPLPPMYRKVYLMTYEQGMKPQEIAEALSEKGQSEMSASDVSRYLHRLHLQLKDKYGESFWRQTLQQNPRRRV